MSLVNFHRYRGGWWLRVLGYGVSVRRDSQHPPVFSIRYGFQRSFTLGDWRIVWLTRS